MIILLTYNDDYWHSLLHQLVTEKCKELGVKLFVQKINLKVSCLFVNQNQKINTLLPERIGLVIILKNKFISQSNNIKTMKYNLIDEFMCELSIIVQ